jgi:hypothetical protein
MRCVRFELDSRGSPVEAALVPGSAEVHNRGFAFTALATLPQRDLSVRCIRPLLPHLRYRQLLEGYFIDASSDRLRMLLKNFRDRDAAC